MRESRFEHGRRSWKRLGAAVVVIAFTMLMATGVSAAPRKKAPSKATGTLLLGMSSSLSGSYGLYGQPMVIGAQMAAATINKAGGVVVGRKRYRLGLNVVDDRSDPQTAVAGMTGLVRDKGVKVTAGPIGNLAPGVMQLTAAANVINLNASGVAASVAGTSQYPLLFETLISNQQRVLQAIAAIKRLDPTAKSVAVVGPNDTSGQAALPYLVPGLQKAGFSVHSFVYPAGTTDLTTTMSSVAASHPDVIFEGWAVSNLQAVGPALDAAGISKSTTVLAWGCSYGDASLVGGRPYIADPVVESDFTVPKATPAGMQFRKRYQKYTHELTLVANATSAEWFYDAIQLFAAAVHKANTVSNTAAIAKAMNRVAIKGISGEKVTFKKNTIQNGTDFTLVKGSTTKTVHIPPQR